MYLNTRYNIAKFRRLGYSEDEIAIGGSDGIEPGQSAMPYWRELGEALLPQRVSA